MAELADRLLQDCGLPRAWTGQPQWRILAIGFGTGADFLAAWRAWKADPQRPRILHFVAIDPSPPAAVDPPLAAQWWGLSPGVHRMAFDDGRVLLTLCVGSLQEMLREPQFAADSVLLSAGLPLKELRLAKALANCCRRGTSIAGDDVSPQSRALLTQAGFALAQGQALHGEFAPAWVPRGQRGKAAVAPGRCVVVGGGLSGAAAAASLARRGWQVQVLDGALHPASGASALPAGLLAPHVSADDNLLSRLVRCGLRVSLQQAQALLEEGSDWQYSGLREQRPGLPPCWHEHAAWIKPAALVRAWLAQPGIEWRGGVHAGRLERQGNQWLVLDESDSEAARADMVVVAAAHASTALLGGELPLDPVRGQVSWAFHAQAQELPAFPLNGNGHFIPSVPWRGATAWLTGSTYDRGDASLLARPADHEANLERLKVLDPQVARQLAPRFQSGEVHAWTGVRCTWADRRPVLGELRPGLWVSTAMGSRGLTFAALCGELMAARLHGEPLPLPFRLAQALDLARRRGGTA
ncbi:MAG: FAD-dependent oxidoreductase [Burkholderiales bacterium]|nr:FAD-dependent oxidoreductase [Burkholderiales bacterium]